MIYIYDGGILISEGQVAASPNCCCQACCSCSTFTDIPVLVPNPSPLSPFNLLTLAITLSEYSFCSDTIIDINFRVINSISNPSMVGSPQIIIGNPIKFDPTDVFDPGNYEVISVNPGGATTVYEPPIPQSDCLGSRVIVTFPPQTYSPGFDQTFTVTVRVNSTRKTGAHPAVATYITGKPSTGDTPRLELEELVSEVCGVFVFPEEPPPPGPEPI